MFAVTSAVLAADEMIIHKGDMVFPPIVFAIIAMVFFIVLALVTFAFRHMAHQHPEHSRFVPYEPIAHPGTERGGDGNPFHPDAQRAIEH